MQTMYAYMCNASSLHPHLVKSQYHFTFHIPSKVFTSQLYHFIPFDNWPHLLEVNGHQSRLDDSQTYNLLLDLLHFSLHHEDLMPLEMHIIHIQICCWMFVWRAELIVKMRCYMLVNLYCLVYVTCFQLWRAFWSLAKYFWLVLMCA